MELWQLDLADAHFSYTDTSSSNLPGTHLTEGVTLFTGERNNRSVAGLSPASIQKVLALALEQQIPLLIEADGSRRHPIKAPADHEPPIPDFVDTVVVSVGLSALGNAISADWVHRPEIFASLSNRTLGAPISLEAIRRVLCHPSGGLKNIPEGARRIVLLNQADTNALYSQACCLAPTLLQTYHAVIITALNSIVSTATVDNPSSMPRPQIFSVYEPIAGVILANEDSSTRQHPLAYWKNEPLIRQVTRTALEAGLSPVIVVTNLDGARIHSTLQDMEVQIVVNPIENVGQNFSTKAGLQSLPNYSNAVVFFSGDQPITHPAWVRDMIETHARMRAPIIRYPTGSDGTYPILFDRAVFSKLLNVNDDAGYQLIISHHPTIWSG
jgi:molybdenum cofactor cytidylyltransferase